LNTRIYTICSIWEAVALTIHEVYRLSELEEVLGELHSVEITEIGSVAVIGKIAVWLPEELAEQLKGLIGRRVAILRLDGYHFRCLDGENDA
jgi:hypothetical protein